MTSPNTGTISGGERIKVIQGPEVVWATRTQFIALLAATPKTPPRVLLPASAVTRREEIIASQSRQPVQLGLLAIQQYVAASAAADPILVTGQLGPITGTELVEAEQDGLTVQFTLAQLQQFFFFTADPSITYAEGADLVPGLIVAFDRGAATGSFGDFRLYKDGADFADASSGSGSLDDVGSYFVRSYLAGNVIYADSDPVVIEEEEAGDVPPPILDDPDDFVSGTNPPDIRVDIPGPPDVDFDKSLYKLVGQFDRPADFGDAFSGSPTSFEVTDLMSFVNIAATDVPELTGQAAGKFRLRARFVLLSNSSIFSVWSNYWTDTLGDEVAAGSSAELAIIDGANKSAYVGVTGTPPLSMEVTEDTGGWVWSGTVTPMRSKSHWEFTIDALDANGRLLWFGVRDSAFSCSSFGRPGYEGLGWTIAPLVAPPHTDAIIIRSGSLETYATLNTLGLGDTQLGDIFSVDQDTGSGDFTVKRKRGGTTETVGAWTVPVDALPSADWSPIFGGRPAGAACTVNFGASVTPFAITPLTDHTYIDAPE